MEAFGKLLPLEFYQVLQTLAIEHSEIRIIDKFEPLNEFHSSVGDYFIFLFSIVLILNVHSNTG